MNVIKYLNKINFIKSSLDDSVSELLVEKNKQIIFFLNTHSIVVSLTDLKFLKAILYSKKIFVDGIGLFIANLFFNKNNNSIRITGYDFFLSFLHRTNKRKKFFFLGSDTDTLERIKKRINNENILIDCEYFSPPFKDRFSIEDNRVILEKINNFNPDVIFVGMTAPKQEKWAYENIKKVHCNLIVCVGAVFSFFSLKESRAPKLFRDLGFEWLYRLFNSPKKIYKRVIFSGTFFIYLVIKNLLFSIIGLTAYKKININIYNNINNINLNKSFVYVAFNLAFISFFYSKKINNINNFVFWPDGITSLLFNNKIKKIAGRNILDNFMIPKYIKNLRVIGSYNKIIEDYLKKKFPLVQIIFNQVPYSTVENIFDSLPEILIDDLCLIILPTPKQEALANLILEKYKFARIICIGGGIRMSAGLEPVVPKFLENLGMEFIWRLQFETIRRLIRLIQSVFYFSLYLLQNKYKIRLIV
jgi:N-acetylglucosaminyldiphosphoundecaprenol N-acetyl-beta-D-mannosaminyltransferase